MKDTERFKKLNPNAFLRNQLQSSFDSRIRERLERIQDEFVADHTKTSQADIAWLIATLNLASDMLRLLP